jgi:hypothetical protein
VSDYQKVLSPYPRPHAFLLLVSHSVHLFCNCRSCERRETIGWRSWYLSQIVYSHHIADFDEKDIPKNRLKNGCPHCPPMPKAMLNRMAKILFVEAIADHRGLMPCDSVAKTTRVAKLRIEQFFAISLAGRVVTPAPHGNDTVAFLTPTLAHGSGAGPWPGRCSGYGWWFLVYRMKALPDVAYTMIGSYSSRSSGRCFLSIPKYPSSAQTASKLSSCRF